MHQEIDREAVSPSDYAVLVRNLPHDMTKEKVGELFESKFQQSNLKVVYVNMCYDIEEIMVLNSTMKELMKQRGFYKLFLRK